MAPAGVPLAVSPAGAGLRRITLYQLSTWGGPTKPLLPTKGYWYGALAFVRCGPPSGFACPVALHPYIRPFCAHQFSYAASGIMVSVSRMVWLVAAHFNTVASPSVINV